MLGVPWHGPRLHSGAWRFHAIEAEI